MLQFENLGDLIERDRDPDKIAIIDLGGENPPREFTYRRLDEIARAVARAVWARGFVRAGLVAVPVNFKFPRATIDFIIADSGAKLVFCDPERRLDAPLHLPLVEYGGRDDNAFEEFLDVGPFTAITPSPREPAMFLYTSGSTGVPKGVVLSHQSHLWVVETRLGPDLARHRYL